LHTLENLKIPFKFLKSPRKAAEQAFGLFLFLAMNFSMMFINRMSITSNIQQENLLFGKILSTHQWVICPIWTALYISLSLSLWILWRSFSVSQLKLEFCFFFLQLFMLFTWHLLFFILQQPLLSLSVMLIGSFIALICFYAFWKKDQLAGIFYIPYLVWMFVLASLNMLFVSLL
jgi:tryptophan-rich sensory protein